MGTKVNKVFNFIKSKALYVFALIGVAMASSTTAYASWSLTKDDKSTANKILANIANLYMTWSIPFIIIAIIMMLVTKDDRKREVQKRVVIGMVIAYIICLCYGQIEVIITNVGSTFGS